MTSTPSLHTVRRTLVPLFAVGLSCHASGANEESEARFFQAVVAMTASSAQLQANLQAARSRMEDLQSGRHAHLPTLSGGMAFERGQTLEGQKASSLSTQAQMDARAKLYHFGADEARVERAQFAREILHEESLALRVATQKEMANRLIRWIELENKNALSARILEAREKLLAQASALFAKGLLAAEELDGNRLDVGLAKIAHEESLVFAQALRTQLASRLGDAPPPTQWPWGRGVDRQLALLEGLDAGRLVASLAPQAMRQAKWELEKSRAELDQIRSESYPSLSAFTGLAKNFGDWSQEAKTPLLWRAGLELSWPILTGFENAARIEAAASRRASAESAIEATRLALLDQVTEEEARIRSLVASLRARESFLERARVNLERARERFLTGRISANELSNEETRTLELEQSLIATVAGLHTAFFSLCESLRAELATCGARIAETKPSK